MPFSNRKKHILFTRFPSPCNCFHNAVRFVFFLYSFSCPWCFIYVFFACGHQFWNFLSGQLYRRKHQWDLAENELKSAKKLLVEYDNIISCTRCKMVFEVTIDMQVGDLYRSLFDKGTQIKSTGSLSDALGLYRSALEKLELAEMVSCIDICQKPEANGGILQNDDSIKEASNRIQQTIKLCSSTKEENSSVCSICRSLNSHKSVFHTRQVPKESDEISLLKTVNRKSQVKNISKKSLRCSTKNLNHQSKARRNGSSNQDSNVMNATSVGYSKFNGSANHELCTEAFSCGELLKEHNGAAVADCGDKEEWKCSKMECWRCLIHQVMETGFMQNIIHLHWECHRRRLVLMLLLKIGTELGKKKPVYEMVHHLDIFAPWSCWMPFVCSFINMHFRHLVICMWFLFSKVFRYSQWKAWRAWSTWSVWAMCFGDVQLEILKALWNAGFQLNWVCCGWKFRWFLSYWTCSSTV